MFEINPKLLSLEPYKPIGGEYRVRLDANESFIPLPKRLKRRFADIASSLDANRYPDAAAAPVCEAFSAAYGVPPEYICASNGSDEMISILFSAFLEDGDRVMITAPDFSMYGFYAFMSGHDVINVPKKRLKTNIPALLRAIEKEMPRILIFSNPCNPTGQGISKRSLRRIIKAADGVNCLVVLDEAYMEFWGNSMIDEIDAFGNLVILKTCSKSLGCAALRVGFSVSGSTLASLIRAAKPPYNVSSFSQYAAAAVLSEHAAAKRAANRIVRSRKELCASLAEICAGKAEVVPTVTNFAVVLTADAEDIHRRLAEKGIAVRRFPGMLRITAGSAEENAALADAMKEIMQ